MIINLTLNVMLVCKTASEKLHGLARVSVFMSFRQKKDYYERFYYITVWLLPTHMDVS